MAVGETLRLKGPGYTVAVTLARGKQGPPGDSFWTDVTVVVSTGSWTFAPKQMTYVGSWANTPETMGLVRGDAGRTTLTAGQRRVWRLSYAVPAAGRDLTFSLHDPAGAVLGNWRDTQ